MRKTMNIWQQQMGRAKREITEKLALFSKIYLRAIAIT